MQIEGIPEGWELVRIGKPVLGEFKLNHSGKIIESYGVEADINYPIVRKIEQPKRYRPFASAEEFKPHRDRWIRVIDTKEEFQTRYVKAVVVYENGTLSEEWNVLFKKYVFDDDGTPFGIEINDN